MLRRILLASVGAVALAGTALAAEPPPAPPPVYVPPVPIFTWTGVYVGGQIGYAWGTTNANAGDNFGDFRTFSFNTNGVIGGAHVGYNLQLNQFVIGLEGDVDGSSLSNTESGVIFPAGLVANGILPANAAILPVTVIGHLRVQGSIRGRLGYAWDRVLLYATGGVAFGGFGGSVSTPFGFDSQATTRVGWTVGGGLEYAVTNNWSIRAEYRYTQYGNNTIFATNAFGSVGGFANLKVNQNRVQVGFSYKFDTAPPPAPIVAKY
jgi:outer membrane immunogenic protein